MDDEQLGREHARACYSKPTSFSEPGPRSVGYAQAALEELERLQREDPGMLGALLEGGNQGARQLNADSLQGLHEIVQNADDLGATIVRFGTKTTDGRRQLLIVHNGEAVQLMHVLPMVYPFLSTKRSKARLKGRFGVGLKTLNRLGANLVVHSAPYHFTTFENLAVRTVAAAEIPGFYDPEHDTLFSLDLDEEVSTDFLTAWFAAWSPGDLLFLDAVRAVTLHDLDNQIAASVVEIVELEEEGGDLNLIVAGVQTPTIWRRFKVDDVVWERYVAQVAVPEGKRRAGKETEAVTPIGVALPTHGHSEGRIHVALPTRIRTGGAFSIDAQFDPATSREELVGDAWNRWLVGACGEVLGSLAVELAHRGSPLAWFAVPVGAATNSTSAWLNERFATSWRRAVEAVAGDESLVQGLTRLQIVDHLQHLSKLLARAGQLPGGDQILSARQMQDSLQHLFGMAHELDEVLAVGAVVAREPVADRPRIGPGQTHYGLHGRGALAVLAAQRQGDLGGEIEAFRRALGERFFRI